jgi:D-alanine-D-alanine ligase
VAGDRWDLVFSIAEGLGGRSREAQVPALLELFAAPYAFSDPLVCAATLDKAVAKQLAAAAGIRTPRFAVVNQPEDCRLVAIDYPLFAKPLAEGTGKGVTARSRIDTPEQLRDVCTELLDTLRQPVLVEAYLPGTEFTTGILGTGAAARVLGTMQITILPNAPAADYTYEIKETCESCVRYGPPDDAGMRAEVEALALAAYRALQCRDAGRVDIRLDRGGRPAFMEINPLPGLHPTHSDLPMIATQEGMSYTALIGAILDSASTRVRGPGAGAPRP